MEVKMTMEEYEFLRKRSDDMAEFQLQIEVLKKEVLSEKLRYESYREQLCKHHEDERCQLKEFRNILDCPQGQDEKHYLESLRLIDRTSIHVLELPEKIERLLFRHGIASIDYFDKMPTEDMKYRLSNWAGITNAMAQTMADAFEKYRALHPIESQSA